MKRIKIADLLVSTLLITSSIVIYFLGPNDNFLLSYAIIGGWQLLSMVFHEYNRCFTYTMGSRWIYHRVCLAAIASLPLVPPGIIVFIALPMGIFYTYLCYHEVFVKMQRPLAVLK